MYKILQQIFLQGRNYFAEEQQLSSLEEILDLPLSATTLLKEDETLGAEESKKPGEHDLGSEEQPTTLPEASPDELLNPIPEDSNKPGEETVTNKLNYTEDLESTNEGEEDLRVITWNYFPGGNLIKR